jgi:hypothetical protein
MHLDIDGDLRLATPEALVYDPRRA